PLDYTSIAVNCFELKEVGQTFVAMQTAQAAATIAPGLRFREQLVVIVDPDRAVAYRTRDAHAAIAVSSPYAGRQSIYGVVGACNGILFIAEFFQYDEGPEDFFLTEEGIGIAVRNQRRRHEEAVGQCAAGAAAAQYHFVAGIERARHFAVDGFHGAL